MELVHYLVMDDHAHTVASDPHRAPVFFVTENGFNLIVIVFAIDEVAVDFLKLGGDVEFRFIAVKFEYGIDNVALLER